MNRFLIPLSALALGAIAVLSAHAFAGDPPTAPAAAVALGNAICPVTGEAVKPGYLVRWGGVDIGFCCPECPPKFSAHPELYAPALLKEMAAQVAALKAKLPRTSTLPPPPPGVVAPPPAAPVVRPPAPAIALPLEIGNAMCPVMNRPVRPGLFTEYHGMKIGLCCGGCDGKLQADPATYLRILRQDPNVAAKMDTARAAWAASQPR